MTDSQTQFPPTSADGAPSSSSATEATKPSAAPAPPKNLRLPAEVKEFIINHLACYYSPKEVVTKVQDMYGVTISPQRVEKYDPTKRAGRNLSEEWKEVFEKRCTEFLLATENIGLTHAAVRLHKLQEMCDIAEERGDFRLMLKLLKQAAIESGRWAAQRDIVKSMRPAASQSLIPIEYYLNAQRRQDRQRGAAE